MRVEIKRGGDGVACWNEAAITAYAHSIDAREAKLAAANPDLVVTPGRVKCYGCRLNDFGLGYGCTAELTRSLYAVAGEVAPRVADAGAPLADIAGLESRIETEQAVYLDAEVTATVAASDAASAPAPSAPSTAPRAPVAPTPPSALPPRKSGIGRLLGRRG